MRTLLLLTLLSLPAVADSIPVTAWQNEGNAAVVLTPDTSAILGPTIRWGSDLLCFSFPVDGDWKAIMTLNGGGYEAQGFVPYGDVFMGFDHLPFFYQGAAGTLRLFEDGQWSNLYRFQYFTPVPEPTTLTMLGSGLLAVAWRRLKRA